MTTALLLTAWTLGTLLHVLFFRSLLMATVADIQTQLTTLQTTVNAIAATPAPAPPVATQADLDSISAALATAQTGLDAIKNA